jgi:hypothetical protein
LPQLNATGNGTLSTTLALAPAAYTLHLDLTAADKTSSSYIVDLAAVPHSDPSFQRQTTQVAVGASVGLFLLVLAALAWAAWTREAGHAVPAMLEERQPLVFSAQEMRSPSRPERRTPVRPIASPADKVWSGRCVCLGLAAVAADQRRGPVRQVPAARTLRGFDNRNEADAEVPIGCGSDLRHRAAPHHAPHPI